MRALLTHVEQTEVQQAIIFISNNNDKMLLNYLFQAATLKHWVQVMQVQVRILRTSYLRALH